MKKFSFIMILFAAALLSACAPKTAAASAAPVVQAPEGIIAEGRVQPAAWLEQSFSVPGQVAEVLAQDGEQVQPGQVLARLSESPEARLALARAEQEALAAQQALDALLDGGALALASQRLALVTAREARDAALDTFERKNSEQNRFQRDVAQAQLDQARDMLAKLQSTGGVNAEQLAAAKARLATAQAALASARAAVDAMELKASMGGALVDADLLPGARVSAGQPVLTVADSANWVVKTDNLTEVDVVSLKVGQKAQVALDALPDQTLNGEITHIAARFEEKRGDITYTVTVRLLESNPALRWGLTAAVQFQP